MRLLFRGAQDIHGRGLDVAVTGGGAFAQPSLSGLDFDRVIDMAGCVVFPGFADAHVHLREPGFSYKETIFAGTRAAARAGCGVLCAMPNLDPAPDDREHLEAQLAVIRRDAAVRVIPFGSITRGRGGPELSRMEEMAPFVAGYSDDGCGVPDDALMRRAMLEAKRLHKVISQHCEVPGIPGTDPESEWRMAERDIRLCEETGCRYHICHVSSRVTVDLVRRAKQRGLPVTCETAPHYLLLNRSDVQDDGRFKMNPPIREEEDRLALVEGVLDGTVDAIATDHAPHSAEEKSRGFEKSTSGIVGLETAFPVLWKSGLFPLDTLVKAMSHRPREIFSLPSDGDFAFFDLDAESVIDPARFLSLGRSTPFEGWTGRGRCRANIVAGQVAWME